MATKNKIQALLITYLQKFGSIDLILPDGVGLEIGCTQETKHGKVISKDYCWVSTNRDDRMTTLDRYSMAVKFDDDHLVMKDLEGLQVL